MSVSRTHEQLALHVVFKGRPYARVLTCEGTPESGPYALQYRGFRLGSVKVELSPRGDLLLVLPPRKLRLPWGGSDWFPHIHILRQSPYVKEILREELLQKTQAP